MLYVHNINQRMMHHWLTSNWSNNTHRLNGNEVEWTYTICKYKIDPWTKREKCWGLKIDVKSGMIEDGKWKEGTRIGLKKVLSEWKCVEIEGLILLIVRINNLKIQIWLSLFIFSKSWEFQGRRNRFKNLRFLDESHSKT